MTRVLIWIFKTVLSLAVTLPNQEQKVSNKQNVEHVNVQYCRMNIIYSDCNTFKTVADSVDFLL